MLLVEQNVRMSLEIADHAYVLDDGSVVYSGPARELARRRGARPGARRRQRRGMERRVAEAVFLNRTYVRSFSQTD